jgi:hypothetical protein
MAYNANIPQPADQLKNSQPQILANFQEINTALNVNHVGFNVADQGKHKFIQFPQQVADPATNPTEYAQYTKLGLFSGSTEVLLRTPNSASIVNMTERYISPSDGWYQLPCGIIVKWVVANIPVTLNTVGILYNFVWPVPNNIPFTVAPFNYSFCFSSIDANDINLIATVDMVQSTNLQFFGRLRASSLPAVNVPAFSVIVTAYGI